MTRSHPPIFRAAIFSPKRIVNPGLKQCLQELLGDRVVWVIQVSDSARTDIYRPNQPTGLGFAHKRTPSGVMLLVLVAQFGDLQLRSVVSAVNPHFGDFVNSACAHNHIRLAFVTASGVPDHVFECAFGGEELRVLSEGTSPATTASATAQLMELACTTASICGVDEIPTMVDSRLASKVETSVVVAGQALTAADDDAELAPGLLHVVDISRYAHCAGGVTHH
jgi:hypothetical protein